MILYSQAAKRIANIIDEGSMIVTDITDMDKKRKRISIDGEYAFALYNQEVNRYRLEVGEEIEASVYGEIHGELIPKRVKARTLYILKSSQKTEKQVRDKLLEGGYTERYAEIGIEYAKRFGYIDDLRYAQYFVENSCRGRSRRDIEQRLYRRGIDRDVISSVLDELRPDTEDDTDAVWAALRRKSVTPDNIGELDFDARRKLYAYLMRKGFSSDCITRVLRSDF